VARLLVNLALGSTRPGRTAVGSWLSEFAGDWAAASRTGTGGGVQQRRPREPREADAWPVERNEDD